MCYAFPTLTKGMSKRKEDDLKESADLLIETIAKNPGKHFYITEVGCGIAGYQHEEIAPLFQQLFSDQYNNVSLPLSFLEIIGTKGYKAFGPEMKCRDKQYTENTLFEENCDPDPCNSGMHFCPNPLDVLNYYNHAPENVYAEVVSVGEQAIEGDKIATNKLKVKTKLKFTDLIVAHFEIVKETIKKAVSNVKNTTNTAGYYAHANTAGYKAHANTAGDKAHANTAGDQAIASSLGFQSKAKASKGWIVIVDWRIDEKTISTSITYSAQKLESTKY